jgi:beta-glucosidase
MKIYVTSAITVIAILASALMTADAQTAPAPLAEFKNPSLPPEVRARELIANMTLEEKASQLGHTAPAIARLGIPEYNWWNEGLHGVARADIATVFPQAIGMAAAWDVPLMHEVANVLGTEFRAKYVEKVHPDGGTEWYRGLTVWSPNINIFRDPRWAAARKPTAKTLS